MRRGPSSIADYSVHNTFYVHAHPPLNTYCFSQLCYSQPNCVAGSGIETPDESTTKDCCAGTNDRQSYADSDGDCVVPQCVGERDLFIRMYMALQGSKIVQPTKFNT